MDGVYLLYYSYGVTERSLHPHSKLYNIILAWRACAPSVMKANCMTFEECITKRLVVLEWETENVTKKHVFPALSY